MIEGRIIDADDDGTRLDSWIKKHYPGLAFGLVQKILRTGQLRVDGKRAKGNLRLATGQKIRIPPQMANAPPLVPQQSKPLSQKEADFIKSLVIYEDDAVIALNKPAGIAVQGGSKQGGRHLDRYLDALSKNGERPKLVHRLDLDTSGVLLLARTVRAARALGDMFKGRGIRKQYWAIVSPVPSRDSGLIDVPIGKALGDGGERVMALDEDDGKRSITLFRVLERAGKKVAFVAFWPKTGRTHQIRVHAALAKMPIVGDPKYGLEGDHDDEHGDILAEMKDLPQRLHLHARRIILPDVVPGGRKRLDLTAPLDDGLKKTWKCFGFDADYRGDPFEDEE